MELVNKTIIRLTSKIPEQYFTSFLTTVRVFNFITVKNPHATTVSGACFDPGLPGKDKRESGFPDTGVTDENHLGIRIKSGLQGLSFRDRLSTQIPNTNLSIV